MQQAIDALVDWATDWQLSISVNNCCVLNVDRINHDTCLYINGNVLPVVESTRDLGIIVSCEWSPSLHVSDIVAKAHRRAAAIHRTFVSRNIHLLVRATVHSLYMSDNFWSVILLFCARLLSTTLRQLNLFNVASLKF